MLAQYPLSTLQKRKELGDLILHWCKSWKTKTGYKLSIKAFCFQASFTSFLCSVSFFHYYNSSDWLCGNDLEREWKRERKREGERETKPAWRLCQQWRARQWKRYRAGQSECVCGRERESVCVRERLCVLFSRLLGLLRARIYGWLYRREGEWVEVFDVWRSSVCIHVSLCVRVRMCVFVCVCVCADWKEIGFDIDEVIKAQEDAKKDKK